MIAFFNNLGAVDITSLVVVLFFVILGVIKGFTWQVVRVAAIFAGMALAKVFSPSFSGWLEGMFSGLEGKSYSIYIAYFMIFLGVIIVGTLLAILLGKILKNMRLKAYDSLLGGVIGLITGWTIIIVLLLFFYSILSEESAFRQELEQSRTARCASWTIGKAHPFIPQEIRDEVRKAAERAEKALDGLQKKADESPIEADDSPIETDGDK
jgi:membrane protein required for colicin V production